MNLSVVILTHNDQETIESLIDDLNFADEIVVVDDNSIDETREILKRKKVKVYQRSLNDNWAEQRNFGLDQAKGDWILFIDSDERLALGTSNEIIKTIRAGKKKGYYLRRIDYVDGKKLEYGEVKQAKFVRLARKGSGRWTRPVHEMWEVDDCDDLAGSIEHRSHLNWSDSIQKIRQYAKIEAKYRMTQQEEWGLAEMVIKPVGKWLNNMINKSGWRDGVRGLQMANLMSYHSWLVRKYLYELQYSAEDKSLRARVWRQLMGLMVILLILGQLGRVQLTQQIALYFFEIVMITQIILTWVKGKRVKASVYSRDIWPFIGAISLSLMVNLKTLGGEVVVASLYAIRFGLYLGYAYSLDRARKLGYIKLPYLTLLRYIAMGLALLGLSQYFLIPDTRFLFYLGWDDHLNRLIGTIFDPSYLGLILVLGLTITELKRGKYYWWEYFILGLALLLTYARSAYLVYGCLVVMLAWKMKSWRFLGVRILGLLILLFSLPRPGGDGVRLERTYSISQRAESVVSAKNIFFTHPIFGIGFNAYRSYLLDKPHSAYLPIHPSSPDNSLMLVLVTTGIIGGLAFTYFNLRLLIKVKDNDIITYSIILILIHSMTNNSYFYPWVMIWMGMLLGDEIKGDTQH